jgi:hypothetical protein
LISSEPEGGVFHLHLKRDVQSMIRKSVKRFSEKIMLNQKPKAHIAL